MTKYKFVFRIPAPHHPSPGVMIREICKNEPCQMPAQANVEKPASWRPDVIPRELLAPAAVKEDLGDERCTAQQRSDFDGSVLGCINETFRIISNTM